MQLPVSLTSGPVRWGDGSYSVEIVASLRRLQSKPWDWVVLLSGQDYPIRPLNRLTAALSSTGFVAFCPATEESVSERRDEIDRRYRYRHYFVPGTWPVAALAMGKKVGTVLEHRTGGAVRVQARPRRAGPAIAVRRQDTIFDARRPCFMGSDYFVASRPAVDAALALLHADPRILAYYRRCFVPSESLFASAFRWTATGPVADDNFHFMRFSGLANPRTITPADLPELSTMDKVFARKFTDDSGWVEQELPLLATR